MDNQSENQLSHKGAKSIGKIHRFLHRKLFRKSFPKTVKGAGFDWNTGFDVRDIIGPITIKNQSVNDSCSGQAGSYFIEIQRRLQKIQEGAVSAKSIYDPIADAGGGTTVPQLVSQLCTKGASLEASVPSYDASGNPLTEAMMVEKSWITPAMLKDALVRAGYTPYDVTVNVDTIAQVIRDWGAAIMEVQAKNGENPGWQSSTPQYPSAVNKNELWAHFMTLIGAIGITPDEYVNLGKGIDTYDAIRARYKANPLSNSGNRTVKCIVALQSEGEEWGDKGIQLFYESYFESGYIPDVFTCCFDNRLIPNSDNFSPFAWWWRWFKIYLGLSTIAPSKSQ